MNQDDKHPDMNTWIDPELEARVVAWVAGEASAFEIAELERLLAEKPELAIFKRRIEAVQGLVAEAVRPDAEPMRLAPERRAKLLQAIGVAPEPETKPAAPVLAFEAPRSRRRKYYQWMTIAAAACVPLAVLLIVTTNVSRQAPRPDPTPAREVAPKAEADYQLSAFEVRSESKVQRIVSGARERVAVAFQDREDRAAVKRPAPSETTAVAMEMPSPQARAFAPEPITIDATAPAAARHADFSNSSAYVTTADRNLPGNKPENIAAGSGLRAGADAGFTGTITPTLSKGIEVQAPAEAKQILADAGGVAPVPLAPPPPVGESVAKLDAFVVSTEREGSARAMSAADAAVPPLSVAGNLPLALKEEAAGAMTFNAPGPLTFTAQSNSAQYLARDEKKPATDANLQFGDTPAAGTPTTGTGAVGGAVVGGTASAAPANETITLSAFTVTAEKDAGAKARANAAANQKNVATKQGGLAGRKDAAPAFTPAQRAQVSEDDAAPAKAKPATPPPVPSVEETSTARESVSTFSLHVSDVSFRLAQAALARGEAPDPARIRPEEIYNAFDYGDPSPSPAEKIACRIEQAAHPFLQQRNLVRIAMKVAATGRGATTPLRLTVLLDTSGSMEREDRVAAVRGAMTALVSLLGPYDRITLIGFSRQPRLLAEAVAGNQARSILDLMKNTPAEGGTNLEEALKLGRQLARRHQLAGAQNRIVLLTDGAANLGNANPAQLAATIEALRQQGIAFDACGVGLDGLDDAMLEALTRKGDGRYYALGAGDATDGGFARQLAGAFRPAAENVKVQVRFNPARVGQYRLIGFEQHRLRTEDFRNDQVDAAELAAEEAAVALYQVEVLPQGAGELGEVFVRFRDPASGAMVERSWTMPFDPAARVFDRATASLQLAGTAALMAEKLRGSPLADQFKLGDLARTVNLLQNHYAGEKRVQELVQMYRQMRRIGGE